MAVTRSRKSAASDESGSDSRRVRAGVPSAAALEKIKAQLQAVEDDGGDGTIHLARDSSLKVSSLTKIFFPKPKVTKGEIMRYYVSVWPYLRPVLNDRPLSLKRFPDGVTG